MKQGIDAYREGYEKGQHDNLAGNVGEAVFGMLREDPDGYFAAGYSDGAARKPFNPHAVTNEKAARMESATESVASDLEKSWYRLCNESKFVVQEIVDYYVSALRAQGSDAAILVGLSDFTGDACRRCKAHGQFKVQFLGRLKHPGQCGWSGYMGTPAYIGHQIKQVFHSGVRAGGSMKDDADRKGDKKGGWVYGISGFLFAAVFRAALAIVLIKLHMIAALFQTDQPRFHLVTRVVTLSVLLIAAGIGIYKVHSASTNFPLSIGSAPTTSQFAGISETERQRAITPSFDCGKARTSVELLICRDGRLASLDVEMVSTYKQVLGRLPQDQQIVFRREHLTWFKDYSRTCREKADDADRAACVADYLSARARELKTQLQ